MADCCLIKKVATVEVYENKNEVRAYGFMAGDRNTPVMEVRFKHLWGESNLSSCKLRWIIVDDVGSLLVGEVPIQSDNTALINLPNELFTGDRRMKVQLTVASCDGERILNLQQFTDLKVINSLAPNEVVEPVYQILINAIYDESQKYLKELETSYTQKYGSLDSLYKSARASLEQYLITAENGGNAEFLQGYSPAHFQKVENTINDLIASKKYNVGDVVEVLGYYEKGDGAGHKRKIEATDDGSGVQLANGLWANIVHNGEVNVSWFGAKGDGVTDDTVAIQKALDYMKKQSDSNKKVSFSPNSKYDLDGVIIDEPSFIQNNSTFNLSSDLIIGKELTVPDLYRQDDYIFEDLYFTGRGSLKFRQYTGLLARFYNCVFESENNEWKIVFDKQNWWPTISNCFFRTENNNNGNFIKAIDDKDGLADFSGNSRLNIDNIRCKWHSAGDSTGIGVKTSATATRILNSDFENAFTGINLCYPSNSSVIQNCYFEQVTENSKCIVIGDSTRDNGKVISDIKIQNVYANLHQKGEFLEVANGVGVDRLRLSNISLYNSRERFPIVKVNNVQKLQTIYVDNTILAENTKVVNLNNYTKVIPASDYQLPTDTNGDFALTSYTPTYTNSRYAIAERWSIYTTDPNVNITFEVLDTLTSDYCKNSVKIAKVTGNSINLRHYISNFNLYTNKKLTLQFIAKSSSVRDVSVVVSNDTNPSPLVITNFKLNQELEEYAVTFYVPPDKYSADTQFVVDFGIVGDLEITGVRVYDAEFGVSCDIREVNYDLCEKMKPYDFK